MTESSCLSRYLHNLFLFFCLTLRLESGLFTDRGSSQADAGGSLTDDISADFQHFTLSQRRSESQHFALWDSAAAVQQSAFTGRDMISIGSTSP